MLLKLMPIFLSIQYERFNIKQYVCKINMTNCTGVHGNPPLWNGLAAHVLALIAVGPLDKLEVTALFSWDLSAYSR